MVNLAMSGWPGGVCTMMKVKVRVGLSFCVLSNGLFLHAGR